MANAMHINELFERQANSNPFARVVVYHDKCMPYQALDKRANRFSHYLKSNFNVKSGNVTSLPYSIVVIALSAVQNINILTRHTQIAMTKQRGDQ